MSNVIDLGLAKTNPKEKEFAIKLIELCEEYSEEMTPISMYGALETVKVGLITTSMLDTMIEYEE
jgi:hypothetical protein